MKHAGQGALEELEPLLVRLRALDGMKEKSRGVFYRGSQAFLHFHEDPAGLFADVRLDGVEFTRRRASTAAEQAALEAEIAGALES